MTTLDFFTCWLSWPFWTVMAIGVGYWVWETVTGNAP